MDNMQELLYGKLMDVLFATKAIRIPTDFGEQCTEIQLMLDNDSTGVINTILKYAVDSASQTNYRIECPNQNVEDLINTYLKRINFNINGQIPSGLKQLSKEYFKERWNGSSLCLLRAVGWTEQDLGGTKVTIPSALYFVNGSSIKIESPKGETFNLGSYKYYLNKINDKNKLPALEDEIIIVRKPFSRWFDKYPIPYAIKQGILKNYKAIEILQDKGDEVVTKVLPYLFLLKKGTESLYLKGTKYTEDDMETMGRNFKKKLKEYKDHRGETPTAAIPFDTEMEHLIPDLIKVLNQELYNQGYRALLAGLGFIDVVQGLASTRKESVLNPAPFIEEVNDGVDDFKSILFDLIQMIILKNKETHPKLFGENNELKVVNSELKINIERIQEILRSGYDRGVISITTYQELLGVDSDVEKERREYEADKGLDETFYPHILTNNEDKGIDIPNIKPSKPKNNKNDKEITPDKQPGSPEVLNYKNSSEDIVKCKKCGHEFNYLSVQEAGMGYVKCPKCQESVTQEDIIKSDLQNKLEIAPYKNLDELPNYIKKMTQKCQEVFMATFNSVYEETEDEGKSFAIANSAARRCMKKQGYTYNKETKTWKK